MAIEALQGAEGAVWCTPYLKSLSRARAYVAGISVRPSTPLHPLHPNPSKGGPHG